MGPKNIAWTKDDLTKLVNTVPGRDGPIPRLNGGVIPTAAMTDGFVPDAFLATREKPSYSMSVFS